MSDLSSAKRTLICEMREGRRAEIPPPLSIYEVMSGVEVQRELIRVWPQARLADLACVLVFDPGFDQVGGEDVALQEELMVTLEVVERRLERSRHARDFGQLCWGQRVDVFVERLTGIKPALDTVESRH